ncbi:hybrid sensor histidine kinase/response regulator, partial [Desulfoprunum benzoelyticum]|uniref:response regulator n=1 Tax=Desulfoprunum benzoelyticum TaxID=1506996 RepID=UPI00196690E2
GLSIVRKLVLRMGGTLCLESVPGKGAAFYISLPFGLPCGPAAEDSDFCGHPSDLFGLRVLMVEDDAVNLLCGKRMLEKAGCVVGTARDGQEALETILDRDFDLVLMDIQMPEMDGMEATRVIRSWSRAQGGETPIVAMTAHAFSSDTERFLAAGMNGHLAKPVSRQDLDRCLRSMPELRRP